MNVLGGQEEKNGMLGIVGKHPSMLAIFEVIRRVAATDATVLITGEERHRQRARCGGAPQAVTPFRGTIRAGALRRDPGRAARERDVRS
jgi:hypothetical protein